MRRLRYADIDAARRRRGGSALLFLTDRCPVGCGHCSVDSRPDSPRITDFPLFREVVEGLCASVYELIGISGGEPFVERRGLALAVDRLTEAGKDVSIVTSGVWATSDLPPRWIRDVISRCGAVVLSTDAFHTAQLPDERFVRAARTIGRLGVWVIVQVVDVPGAPDHASRLLEHAFGARWSDHAEIHRVAMLARGRAETIFQVSTMTAGRDFGPCHLARSPVVRYDGLSSVCCNEAVIVGRGPADLRRTARDRDGIAEVLAGFDRHALFRAVGAVGPGALTADPRFADLADQRFRSVCDVCWLMTERVDGADDPLLAAASEWR